MSNPPSTLGGGPLTWRGGPGWNWPSATAGGAALVSAFIAYKQVRALLVLQALGIESGRMALVLGLMTVVWLAIAIGLFLERNLARTVFRAMAAIQAVFSLTLLAASFGLNRPWSPAQLVQPAILIALAYLVEFRDEWREPFDWDRTVARVRGRAIQVWHQLRRLCGHSYIPWNVQPESVVGEPAGSLFPAVEWPGWQSVTPLVVRGGSIWIGDPFGEADSEVGLHVAVPNGTHRVLAQVARFGRHGRIAVRVRFEWGSTDDAELREHGQVRILSDETCIVDAARKCELAIVEDARGYGPSHGHAWAVGQSSDGDAVAIVVNSGDGTFGVCELVHEGLVVGVVVEFEPQPWTLLGTAPGWRMRRQARST